jgi:hypothetical protein
MFEATSHPVSSVVTRPARPVSVRRFHVPFEHGAWWSFFSTLLVGLGVALYKGVDAWAALALFLSLAAGFVAQDWGQALLAALLRRPSQALSPWQAWQGWALGSLSVLGAWALLARLQAAQRGPWLLLLGALGAAAVLGLISRIAQSGRGRKSLAATALLLASPALPFGVLAFGAGSRALFFWAWPLAYYPAATLAAQSFVRGFPERARWAGPALAGALACVLAGAGAWIPAALLLAQALRLQSSIRRRWRLQPAGLPEGRAIRRFGREQAFFGVTLTLLWALSFASMP